MIYRRNVFIAMHSYSHSFDKLSTSEKLAGIHRRVGDEGAAGLARRYYLPRSWQIVFLTVDFANAVTGFAVHMPWSLSSMRPATGTAQAGKLLQAMLKRVLLRPI